MFEENLFISLQPLLAGYPDSFVKKLASKIARLVEINPREGANISSIRDSIIGYLNSPETLNKFMQLQETKQRVATEVASLDQSIADLEKLNTEALKSQLEVQVAESTIAKRVYSLNFGYKQLLGEILEASKHNYVRGRSQ